MNLKIILLIMIAGLLCSLGAAQPNLVYPGQGGPAFDGSQMNYPCSEPCQLNYPCQTSCQLNYPCTDPYQCSYQCNYQCGHPDQIHGPYCCTPCSGPGQSCCTDSPFQCASSCTTTYTCATSCATICQQQPVFNCGQPSSGWQCPSQSCPGPSCTPIGPCNCGYCTAGRR